jgi:hypothetical protein
MKARGKREKAKPQDANSVGRLIWLKATYSFHSYAYREPRSVFASAVALPVVSPTTVLLGIASTLFRLGCPDEVRSFLKVVHQCKVRIDPPISAVFFRAFHQVRRYESDKWDKLNPRVGLTTIDRATREYGLLEGPMTIFVGVPEAHMEPVKVGLTNLTHLGTHDSLCSLIGEVEPCTEPQDVIYMPHEELAQHIHRHGIEALGQGVTIVTLSRFNPDAPVKPVGHCWYMSGGRDTEKVRYAIPGQFVGTSRGKIYRKS